MSSNNDNPELNIFLAGFVVGMIACVVIAISSFSGKTTIQSRKIIVPEKQLTTDGKTVDTLYIYKQ